MLENVTNVQEGEERGFGVCVFLFLFCLSFLQNVNASCAKTEYFTWDKRDFKRVSLLNSNFRSEDRKVKQWDNSLPILPLDVNPKR